MEDLKDSFKYIFFGTTSFSKELLLFLVENSLFPKAIFSIPQEFSISYSEKKVKNSNYANLKEIADKYRIDFYEIDSTDGMRIKDYEDVIRNYKIDLLLVLGWYYMIPKKIRNLSRNGAWGIHASLLPKYAGGSPLNWAIINGEEESGVTLFRMKNGVDDGDIIAQKSFFIDYKDTIKEVYAKATIYSKEILNEALSNIDNILFTPQDRSKIEVYPQRKPEDGEIDWYKNSKNIYDFIRAQTLPYPCAFSSINNQTLKILDSKVIDIKNDNFKKGEIVLVDKKTLVAVGDKYLELGMVDDGKKKYRFEDYARTQNLWGEVFGANSLKLGH